MQVDTNNMNEGLFCSPAHMRTLEGTGRAAEGATADKGEPFFESINTQTSPINELQVFVLSETLQTTPQTFLKTYF